MEEILQMLDSLLMTSFLFVIILQSFDLVYNLDTYKNNNHNISNKRDNFFRQSLLTFYITFFVILPYTAYYQEKFRIPIIISFVYLAIIYIADAMINGMFKFGKEDKIKNSSLRQANIISFLIVMIVGLIFLLVQFAKPNNNKNNKN